MEDDLDLGLLQEQYKKRFLTNQLQDSQNPYADLGLQLAGGGIDLLSRHAQGGADIAQMLTGINQPRYNVPGAEARVKEAIQARETKKRQAALDDVTALSSIQKLIDARKEKEMAALKGPLELQKLQAEIKKLERAPTEEGGKEQKESRKLEIDLRKEYQGLDVTKDTQKVASAYEKVKAAAQNPSAAGDLSLIFGYMKMLDPGSTVREGEFANAQNAAGVPDQIRNAYNRAKTGERLNETQRADFVGQAQRMFEAQLQTQAQFDKQYQDLASQYGVNPSNIVRKYEVKPLQSQQAGETKVVGGVTYRKVQGGWQKVK